MKNVYSPKFEGQAKDFSLNKMIEPKKKLKNFLTVDEYGELTVKKLRIFKRK